MAESTAQAEDDLTAAMLHTRQHMGHARAAYNPPDFHVDPGLLNPWNNPLVSDAEGVRYALDTGAIYGTPQHVAEQVAALRQAGVQHSLCQMSFGCHEFLRVRVHERPDVLLAPATRRAYRGR